MIDGRLHRIERLAFNDSGAVLLWTMIFVTGLIVFPPLVYLIETSFTIERLGMPDMAGIDNFLSVLRLGGWKPWKNTILYAAGSSAVAIFLGLTSAWIVARTNAWCRQISLISAYLALAAPVMIKGIGWILLLGPNKGLINEWLRNSFGMTGVPIDLFTLGGMATLEGILWTPVVLLLCLPTLSAMDPALEEVAAMSGANRSKTFLRITLPLAAPGVLAVLFLTFIRSLESFEVPLLIGVPGGIYTFTTLIYQTIHSGFMPRYGEASAFAVLLIVVMLAPLFLYYRATRQSQKYATITGKGFRPSRMDLGGWRPVAGLYLLIIPISLLAPLAILLWTSFLPLYQSPHWSDLGRMSFANYIDVLTQPLTLDGIRNGMIVAGISATVVAAFTFLVAYIVVRRREPVRWILDAIGSLPLVLPGVVLGTAILIQFLNLTFIPIYGTIWIMVLAFLIRYLPYGIRFCYSGIIAIDRQLEESARSCGAGLLTVLLRIVLPLALPAVTAIWIYVFLHSIRDLSLPVLLAGPRNKLIAVVILDLWNDGKIPQVGALSILLAITVSLFGWILMRLSSMKGTKSI